MNQLARAREQYERCEHEWVLTVAEVTWSGPGRVSVCSHCGGMLREYLPSSASSRSRSSSRRVSTTMSATGSAAVTPPRRPASAPMVTPMVTMHR